MPGMCSSIAEARVGISHAPRSSECWNAWPASRTRSAIALTVGAGSVAPCEFTIRFMLPCRYSMTSRERCRATAAKPSFCSSAPNTCACEVEYSMNSMPSMPSGFFGSGRRSLAVMASPASSFGLDARLLHDPSPLLHLRLDDVAEVLGRAALDLDAGAVEARAHVLQLEGGVDGGVEPCHGFLRRAGGAEDAAPGGGVVAGHSRSLGN